MGVSLPIRSDPQTRTTTTKKRCRAFLMKPLSPPNSLHLHQQSPGCRGLPQSLQRWHMYQLDELLYQSFNMSDKDKMRLYREFYYPPRISASGNYYPRYKVQGDSQTGTSHVSYLSRPYFSYLVPSCYRGYSKYVYVTKIN